MFSRITNALAKLKTRKSPFEVETVANEIILRDKNKKHYIALIYDEHDGFTVEVGGNVQLKIKGGMNVSTDGETNIVSFKDMNIDTWKSKLNLNSRKASQIKDDPEAIEFREYMKQKLIDFEKFQEQSKYKRIEPTILEHSEDCPNKGGN